MQNKTHVLLSSLPAVTTAWLLQPHTCPGAAWGPWTRGKLLVMSSHHNQAAAQHFSHGCEPAPSKSPRKHWTGLSRSCGVPLPVGIWDGWRWH